MGVCPQFDIHHADLTAEEHLLFYARLKGVILRREKRVVEVALRQVRLLLQILGLRGEILWNSSNPDTDGIVKVSGVKLHAKTEQKVSLIERCVLISEVSLERGSTVIGIVCSSVIQETFTCKYIEYLSYEETVQPFV